MPPTKRASEEVTNNVFVNLLQDLVAPFLRGVSKQFQYPTQLIAKQEGDSPDVKLAVDEINRQLYRDSLSVGFHVVLNTSMPIEVMSKVFEHSLITSVKLEDVSLTKLIHAGHIAAALNANSRLTALDISFTEIGDKPRLLACLSNSSMSLLFSRDISPRCLKILGYLDCSS